MKYRTHLELLELVTELKLRMQIAIGSSSKSNEWIKLIEAWIDTIDGKTRLCNDDADEARQRGTINV